MVEDALSPAFLGATRDALYRAQEAIHREIGEDKLRRAGEIGVLRLMMKFDPHFFAFLDLPELREAVDSLLSPTAILHLQNGFVLPPSPPGGNPKLFQNQFHQDFRRVLNGYLMSVNVFFAITDFTARSGATLVVPGTHQQSEPPKAPFLQAKALAVECPAGSMILFDSTLWHAAGENLSESDRLAVNHQFTRSYLKQQIDYPRALGEAAVKDLSDRTRQLLGFHTRVPASLDEYYRPPDQRLYRGGQG